MYQVACYGFVEDDMGNPSGPAYRASYGHAVPHRNFTLAQLRPTQSDFCLAHIPQ